MHTLLRNQHYWTDYKEEIGDVEILKCKLENITEDLNIILEKLGAKSYCASSQKQIETYPLHRTL